jgi:hypothetical protein
MKEQKSISPQRYRKNGMLRNLETELNLKEKEYFTTEDTENTKKKVSATESKYSSLSPLCPSCSLW